MSYLIAPRKFDGFSGTKILPTIDIFEPLNLKVWGGMRKICLDYGKTIDLRLQSDLAVTLLLYLALVAGMALHQFGLKSDFYDVLWDNIVPVMLEITFVILLALFTIEKAGSINSYFKTHKRILMENKTFLQDIYSKAELYFHSENQAIPKNYLYKFCVERLNLKFQNSNTKLMMVKEHLQKLIDLTDEAIDDL